MADRVQIAKDLANTVCIVENHLMPKESRLCDHIALQGLGMSNSSRTGVDLPTVTTRSTATREDIVEWEESFYSIDSSVNDDSPSSLYNTSLSDFLEGISVCCGRRGSRSSLTKLYNIAASVDGRVNCREVSAYEVIRTAYNLAIATSYLKNASAKIRRNTPNSIINPKELCIALNGDIGMEAMVASLVNSAKKQRQRGGGGGFSTKFDFSYSAPTSNASDSNDSTISLEEFIEWAETTVPMMASALPTFLQVLLFFFRIPTPTSSAHDNSDKDRSNEPQFPPGVTPLWIPTLTVETKSSTISPADSTFFPELSSFDLFALTCTTLSLASGRWHRLFSSEANGLSCNRLMHSILGYGGPTVMVIRSKKGDVFGAYTSTPWSQESGGFYGNSDCFLFRLGPDAMGVYHPKGGDSTSSIGIARNNWSNNETSETRNFMYFNPEARSKGYDGLAHGIGFGGNAELPRLYIDEILDGSSAKSDDLTFDNGPLLSGDSKSNNTATFEVEAIEVWGVGSSQIIEEALYARDGQRRDAEKRIRQAMKGTKGAMLEDMKSGLTGSKMFQHREQMRGRDGGCDLEGDENEKGEQKS